MQSGRGHPARPAAEAAGSRSQARRRGLPDDFLHSSSARSYQAKAHLRGRVQATPVRRWLSSSAPVPAEPQAAHHHGTPLKDQEFCGQRGALLPLRSPRERGGADAAHRTSIPHPRRSPARSGGRRVRGTTAELLPVHGGVRSPPVSRGLELARKPCAKRTNGRVSVLVNGGFYAGSGFRSERVRR
jgi:hypothetical protein